VDRVTGSFAWKVGAIAALLGGGFVLWATRDSEPWVRLVLTGGAVLAAFLYGFAWVRVFGSPYDDEELRGVGPLSTLYRQQIADSVYLTAPLGVLVWIVAVVTQLVLGYFSGAAATVGVTGVVVLIVRWLTKPPHRRRRRRRPHQPR